MAFRCGFVLNLIHNHAKNIIGIQDFFFLEGVILQKLKFIDILNKNVEFFFKNLEFLRWDSHKYVHDIGNFQPITTPKPIL